MKTVMITGASSGLGWELSLTFAKPSVKVIVSGRNRERLLQLQQRIEEKGGCAEVFVCDLLTKDGQEEFVTLLEKTPCELLVLNAGIGRYGRFSDVPIEDSKNILALNVETQMTLAHAWCRTSKKGKIVFIASIAAFFPCPGMITYAASKACIVSFAEGLRYELRGTNQKVLTVCPGQFRSHFQESAALKPLSQEPSSREAASLARKIVRAIERKEGIYTPWPWKGLLMLRRLIPQRLVMPFLEKKLLGRVVN
jgi:short-subunit dehydrogenase